MFINKSHFSKLVIAAIICVFVWVLSNFFRGSSISVLYANLRRSGEFSPSWAFNASWFVLFALLGILVPFSWRRILRAKIFRFALPLFVFTLIFNACWSIIFFSSHSERIALSKILSLWIIVVGVTLISSKIPRFFVWIFVMYLFWAFLAMYFYYLAWTLS